MHLSPLELENLAATAARDNLLAYAIGHFRDYKTPPHLMLLAEKLMAVERGEIKRLAVFMPPRHGKSNLASEVFPAWYLGRNPNHQVLFTTYGQDLADGFGRKVRNAVSDPKHVRSFPGSVLASDSASSKRFNTEAGGVYYAVGAGGAVTGRGADCIVEGTLVNTAAGLVAIENLQIGTSSGKILSLNLKESRLEYRELQAVASREADGVYRITTESGRVLEVTGNHRIFVGGQYRPASSVSPGESVVRLLQGGVCPSCLSGDEVHCQRAHGSLLQQGLLGVASRSEECEGVRGVRNTCEAERSLPGCEVLRELPPSTAGKEDGTRTSAEGLPNLRGGILSQVARWREVRRLLWQKVFGDRSFQADVGGLQPQVEGWSYTVAEAAPFCQGVSGDASADSGTRRQPVRGVCKAGDAACSPHRQLADEQCCIEPCDAMCGVSQQVACGEGWQAELDVVALVERVHAQARVYDIQVEENENFFAGGVLVHNCLIIDDPLKNREEADSRLIRDKLWDWFASTAYTRLMPGGAVCLIQCMTGDTPVMMADGTEKPLQDIRVGDDVATYRDGALSTSTVLNWASSGVDLVYVIKTTSGKIVRANGRHPFLVSDDGELKWIKTKNLRPGQEIFRVSGENGKVKPALRTAATSLSSAVGIATRTTTRRDGLTGFAHHLSTVTRGVLRTLSTATGSPLTSTTKLLSVKAVCAQSASSLLAITSGRTGATNSALTIAMTQVCSGLCSAMTAILSLVTQKHQKSQSQQQPISDFITDAIAEVIVDGYEEVFDVQIADTENFIANGLVSHNTRWHEDDLAGRLLMGHEDWEVINLPAIAEHGDMLGRQIGSALWPEQYPVDVLENIKQTIGEREFAALYQQRPSPLEGALFRRDWIGRQVCPRSGFRIAMGVDLALSNKQSADYTAIAIIARDEFGKLYVLDAVRERVDFPSALRLIRNMADKWNPKAIAIEQVAYQAVVVQELLRSTTLPIRGVTPDKDKVTRAQPLALRYEQGLVHHAQLPSWFEDELLAFPQSQHDDAVDALVYAYQAVMKMSTAGDVPDVVHEFSPFDSDMGY